jgi:Arc/MetJ-type ribon-helix-helix transcriptional regulator
MDHEYSSVSIPKPLYEKIKALIKDTGFRSVSEYTNFLLRESVSAWKTKEKPSTKKTNASKDISAAEQRIRQKLEALGYI